MSIKLSGLDPEKCRQRNRVAARRDGVDAAPVNLLAGEPRKAGDVITARGRLPKDEAEALAVINEIRGGEPLSAEQVYVHYLEAASSRFIGDRYMFLDGSTLRAIADESAAGFAFMNSHRTGAISTPSELPFGRTFAGRYEHFIDEDGTQRQRTLLGIYMLRGINPNGSGGPSTDDLHAAIAGGTIFDVSMGLYGGRRVCDVCDNELNGIDRETGEYVCPHVPGTHRKMSGEQVAAQKAKGVPDGHASYSLHDARPGEVSAVFDGAVPGAGFRKAIGLSRRNQLSKSDLADARAAYSTLLSKGDLPDAPDAPPARRKDRTAMPFNFRDAFNFWKAAGEPEEIDLDSFAAGHDTPEPEGRRSSPPPAPQAGGDDPEKAALRKENERLRKERIAERADRFAADQVAGKKAIPAQRDALSALHARLAFCDATNPAEGEPLGVGLLEQLMGVAPSHHFTEEVVNANPATKTQALASDPAAVAGTAEAPDPIEGVARKYAARANGTATKN